MPAVDPHRLYDEATTLEGVIALLDRVDVVVVIVGDRVFDIDRGDVISEFARDGGSRRACLRIYHGDTWARVMERER